MEEWNRDLCDMPLLAITKHDKLRCLRDLNMKGSGSFKNSTLHIQTMSG